jgi:hypothetical protein
MPLLAPVTMKIRPFCDGRSAAVHPVQVMIMDSSGCRKLVMITGQNVVADDTNRVESVSSATIFPGEGQI